MADGEPYTLRGVSTVRRKVFGNLFRKEQGAEYLSYEGQYLISLQYSESKINSKGETVNTRFVWIANLNIYKNNFSKITKGGRLRWKIENEGFNTQKNRRYNLEHSFSSNEMAMKNFYLILQIAHTIGQLIKKRPAKDKIEKVFGSITNVFHQLLKDLRTKFIGLEFLNFKPIQIRLSSPP
ncbi:MAG: hypothetical protein NTV16_01625 [Actinobacteria bacterium]|nr:hypothetical protein [Actinomycetota bacterium]